MEVYKLLFINTMLFILFLSFFSSMASYSSYDTVSNLTHTCKIHARIVCVEVEIVNKTCVDPKCLIYSGGNYNACSLIVPMHNLTMNNLTSCNLNTTLNNTSNVTCANQSMNATATTCNGTWLYPSNKSLCLNDTSWNKTVCEMNNVTCKVNSTQCSLNPVFYIGGFFNLNHLDGWGNLPAAQMAVNEVNKHNTTLTNITLALTATQSTQGLLSHGTELLYTYFHSGPPKLMLLLPQENDLAKTVAAYAGLKQWGALQFSYATKDNSLASNKKLFPRFFRLNPLVITYNRLRATFVATYPKWKNDVGLLFFASSYYEEINLDLHKRLMAKGINVVANVGFRSTPENALDVLKAKNAHIILTTFPYQYAKKLFCKAFKLKMFGPHYVWITYRQLPYKFWVPGSGDDLDCSEYEMRCTVDNHFSIYRFNPVKGNAPLITKKNVSFSKTYNNLVDVGNSTKNRSYSAFYAYDAVWTITNILQRARQIVERNGKVLNELSYGDVNETQLFQTLAEKTDFNGVTGRVRFFENGNRKFEMSVIQIRFDGYGYIVGSYDEDKDIYSPANIKWPGGIPYERTIELYEWRYIELVLFVVLCIFAAFGILYAIFCLFVVIKYRRERCIRYTSPTINVLIILGCLLCFITVILYGVDYQIASESIVSSLCKVRLWMFSLGFTLCVGGLWVKVWTLYQILIDRRVYKKRIIEYWMFGLVVLFVIIDVIYLAIWTAKDRLYRTIKTVIDQPEYQCFETISGNPFRATMYYIEICDCDNLSFWLGIFLAYKALFLLCGFYMSWKVRNVFTRKLIDAQYAAKLLLLAVPLCFLGLIFGLTLRLYPTPHYALLGIIMIIYTYIVLGFLYGHKIINIFCRSKHKIKVRSEDSSTKYQCICCPAIFCSWLASLCCCTALVRLQCCKSLWNSLFRGPTKARGSFVKDMGDDRMDYEIGDMPGDRERQIIILQKELQKKEENLLQLRRYGRSTQAVKQTQTTGFGFYNNNDGHEGSSTCSESGHSNKSFEDERQVVHVGKPNYNRFKVFHQKLDFSHVGSRVDSGLEGKSAKRNAPGETFENISGQWTPHSQDSEILGLQKRLFERERELDQLKTYLGLNSFASLEAFSKRGSLASIGETYEQSSIPDVEVQQARDPDYPGRNVHSVTIEVNSEDNEDDKLRTDGEPSGNNTSSNGVQTYNSPSDYSISPLALNEKENGFAFPIEVYSKQPNMPKDQELNAKSAIEMDLSDHAKENDKNDKNRSSVKILNSPYDYSHVQSRLYISQLNKHSPNKNSQRFKRKVRQLSSFGMLKNNASSLATDTAITSFDYPTSVNGIENNKKAQESDQNQENENKKNIGKQNVKIFGAVPDYSNVKSRVFDSLSSNNKKPNLTPTSDDDKEEVSKKNEQDKNKESDKGVENGSNVKIFNSPTNYSHVKSRLFDSSSNGSPEENQPPKMTNEREQQGKENDQFSQNRSNVKIFNAPSDYSHVKSRLYDSSSNRSTPDSYRSRQFQRKVQQLRSFGVLKPNTSAVPKTANKIAQSNNEKEESPV